MKVNDLCAGCCKGKMQQKKIVNGKKSQYKPFQKLVMDTIGPYPNGWNAERGALVITDIASQYKWIYTYKQRSECGEYIRQTIELVQNLHPKQLRYIKSDNALEFKTRELLAYYKNNGLLVEFSAPFIHEENGRAEISNKTLLAATRSLLFTARLSVSYWPFALNAAVFQQNMIIPVGKTVSPYTLLTGKEPEYKRLRIFGAKGYAHVPNEKRRTFDSTGIDQHF